MSPRTIIFCLAACSVLLASCAHAPPAPSPFSGMQAVDECRGALGRGEDEAALRHLVAARASSDPAVAEAALALQAEVLPRVLEAVEGLRAVRKMQSYEAALRLLDEVVVVDPSKQPLRDTLAQEFDRHLWEQYLKLEHEREESLENRDRELCRPTNSPPHYW